MKDIVNASKFSQAGSMVGKTASVIDAPWDFTNSVSSPTNLNPATNKPAVVTGTIDSVQFDTAHGKALVKINGNYYDLDKVQNISSPPAPTTTGTNTTGGVS